MSEIHSNHEEMFLFLSSTLITPNNQSNSKDLSLLFIYYKLLPSFFRHQFSPVLSHLLLFFFFRVGMLLQLLQLLGYHGRASYRSSAGCNQTRLPKANRAVNANFLVLLTWEAQVHWISRVHCTALHLSWSFCGSERSVVLVWPPTAVGKLYSLLLLIKCMSCPLPISGQNCICRRDFAHNFWELFSNLFKQFMLTDILFKSLIMTWQLTTTENNY